MLITPQFVEALRSAALTFRISQPIHHIDSSRVQFGKLMLVSYDAESYSIEDVYTGRVLMEISSQFPLTSIVALMEFYGADTIGGAIIPLDPRQVEFSFAE